MIQCFATETMHRHFSELMQLDNNLSRTIRTHRQFWWLKHIGPKSITIRSKEKPILIVFQRRFSQNVHQEKMKRSGRIWGLESPNSQFLAVWPWESSLTSRSLNVLICKTGMKRYLLCRVVVRVLDTSIHNWLNWCEEVSWEPGVSKASINTCICVFFSCHTLSSP